MSTYNGWTNRATWAVALHINNDQGWQEDVHDSVRETLADYSDPDQDDQDDIVNDVANNLEQNVRPLVDPHEHIDNFGDISLSQWLDGPGVAAQDIGDLADVNWTELAKSFIADVK